MLQNKPVVILFFNLISLYDRNKANRVCIPAPEVYTAEYHFKSFNNLSPPVSLTYFAIKLTIMGYCKYLSTIKNIRGIKLWAILAVSNG